MSYPFGRAARLNYSSPSTTIALENVNGHLPTTRQESEVTFRKKWVVRPTSFSVFFKVFERVSRWSLRVSTPFSLLCLILLTDFHKNSSFPPNMLNYLNTTFTFGKQIKDNFINRKVEYRPTYSFTHFRASFSYGESRGQGWP